MSDLKETDEPVEKAKGLIRGGSLKNWRGMVRRDGANAKNMSQGKTPLARGLQNGARLKRARSFLAARVGRVRKSSDPISTLYAEVEKAKGLIRGGSRKTLRRIADRAHKDPKNSRLARAYRYMAHRNPGERKGVYKSALGELDAAIEKARGLIRGGSDRMYRRVAGARDVSRAFNENSPRSKRLKKLTGYLANRERGRSMSGSNWPYSRRGKYK